MSMYIHICFIFINNFHFIKPDNENEHKKWAGGNLATIGWSNSEDLLCVSDTGNVKIHDLFGNHKHTFDIHQEVSDTKIIGAKIFPSQTGTGVAVMTTKFRIFLVNSIDEIKVRQFPEISNPTCWEIVTENRNTTCLVARNREIYQLTQGSTKQMNITIKNDYSAIIKMGVSFGHNHIALYTNTGIVWLGSSDLTKKYLEYNTGRSEPPTDIAWINDADDPEKAEAIAITYPSLLIVIGCDGESNAYPYDSSAFLIPEMDGVRVLSNGCHEMIQKIPACVNNIFSINSQKASSFLYEAHSKFVDQSHQSDEYLCMAKPQLQQAVRECIDASCYEFDPEIQKILIKAAYFGKGFINSFNPDDYIKKCRFLRVLNAIRHPNIGIPLTYNQFNHLKPNVILDRLIFRKYYGLAIQIAKHLKLSESRILKHWAFYKVKNDKDDREVVNKIGEKLRNPLEQDVRFSDIAKRAEECGRRDLALMLLQKETNPSLKVPLLLKLEENKNALLAATQSGDTGLIYTVLLKLKTSTHLSDFLMIIRCSPIAQNLFKKYCMEFSVSVLKDIFNQEDDFLSQAQFNLRECIAAAPTLESNLSSIGSLYKKAHKDVEAELCEDTKKILKHQKVFNEKSTIPFTGLSIHDTVEQLLAKGDIRAAEKLKNEFKIPDRRYWWIRIQVFASQYQWEELEKFSKLKKSPIGYEPFVEVCLKKDNVVEAKKYIAKSREDQKAKLFVRAK